MSRPVELSGYDEFMRKRGLGLDHRGPHADDCDWQGETCLTRARLHRAVIEATRMKSGGARTAAYRAAIHELASHHCEPAPDGGEGARANPTVADGFSAGEAATDTPGESVDKPALPPAPEDWSRRWHRPWCDYVPGEHDCTCAPVPADVATSDQGNPTSAVGSGEIPPGAAPTPEDIDKAVDAFGEAAQRKHGGGIDALVLYRARRARLIDLIEQYADARPKARFRQLLEGGQ